MQFVIKLFPEIIVKSPGVRRHQTKILQDNIRRILKPLDTRIKVRADWEKLEVEAAEYNQALRLQIIEKLSCIPGIAKFSETETHRFDSLEQICDLVVQSFSDRLAGKTYGVRVRRSGKQSFNSMDAERAVGSALMLQANPAAVDLNNPEIWVELEIREDRLFILGETWSGLGGFPIGSQDKVISLISGGFDSSVSSFQSIRRGMLTHFMFFNIGGRAHEIAVRQMVYHLWSNYSSSHTCRYISLPFEEIVAEISKKAPANYATVLLKRYMMRCASKIAAMHDIDGIATGESVGQVSSQTLANLRIIDEHADCLVMRPLINMDKGDIIDIARRIGTASMAEKNPEYCGLQAERPTTKARRHKVEEFEAFFDPEIEERVIAKAVQMPVSRIIEDISTIPVDLVSVPPAGAIILDVRHPDECLDNELVIKNHSVVAMPFFEIQNRFSELPQDQSYFLYCDRGIISRLHAELLLEAGCQNIGVYKPS